MNDGKKRRSSAELPAHKRFEKSRSRWIYPSFQNTVFVFCGDWGSAPTSGNVKKCAVGKYPKSEKLGSAGQAACCACAHSRYLTGGSPSGLRV